LNLQSALLKPKPKIPPRPFRRLGAESFCPAAKLTAFIGIANREEYVQHRTSSHALRYADAMPLQCFVCPLFGLILADVERLLVVVPRCDVTAFMCDGVQIFGRPALWGVDDLASGQGMAIQAIVTLGLMFDHARFGLDGLSNGEESLLVQCNAHSGTISML
jgi:hypothetical protein